jgi:hypothetical protein
MRKTCFTLTLAGLAFAGRLLAGGFWLQLGNPEASAEARKMNAAVTIKAVGCHDPASATVTAAAIGAVNGQRRTIALDVVKLSEPGMFAITQQWPKEGKWVIRVTGRNGEQFTNTLIAAGPGGVDRLHAKSDLHEFASTDVEAFLR